MVAAEGGSSGSASSSGAGAGPLSAFGPLMSPPRKRNRKSEKGLLGSFAGLGTFYLLTLPPAPIHPRTLVGMHRTRHPPTPRLQDIGTEGVATVDVYWRSGSSTSLLPTVASPPRRLGRTGSALAVLRSRRCCEWGTGSSLRIGTISGAAP